MIRYVVSLFFAVNLAWLAGENSLIDLFFLAQYFVMKSLRRMLVMTLLCSQWRSVSVGLLLGASVLRNVLSIRELACIAIQSFEEYSKE